MSDSSDGSISIDGTNIKNIGLHLLRKNISYIPQSPFLIQGSVRENMDPFKQYTDEQIETVLKEVNLLDHIKANCEYGIKTEISDSNNIFSMG